MRLVLLAALALPAALLVGCENSCQQLCDVIADVYDTCGKEYGDAEVRECKSEHATPPRELLDTCRYGVTTDADGVTNFEKDATCATIDGWEQTFAGDGGGEGE